MTNLPRRTMRHNAARIVELADAFGRLPLNDHGQTVEQVLNLSIPCARLIVAGIVESVVDTCDGVNDDAVAEMGEVCRRAVEFTEERHGRGWWNERAVELGVPFRVDEFAAAPDELVVEAMRDAGLEV